MATIYVGGKKYTIKNWKNRRVYISRFSPRTRTTFNVGFVDLLKEDALHFSPQCSPSVKEDFLSLPDNAIRDALDIERITVVRKTHEEWAAIREERNQEVLSRVSELVPLKEGNERDQKRHAKRLMYIARQSLSGNLDFSKEAAGHCGLPVSQEAIKELATLEWN